MQKRTPIFIAVIVALLIAGVVAYTINSNSNPSPLDEPQIIEILQNSYTPDDSLQIMATDKIYIPSKKSILAFLEQFDSFPTEEIEGLELFLDEYKDFLGSQSPALTINSDTKIDSKNWETDIHLDIGQEIFSRIQTELRSDKFALGILETLQNGITLNLKQANENTLFFRLGVEGDDEFFAFLGIPILNQWFSVTKEDIESFGLPLGSEDDLDSLFSSSKLFNETLGYFNELTAADIEIESATPLENEVWIYELDLNKFIQNKVTKVVNGDFGVEETEESKEFIQNLIDYIKESIEIETTLTIRASRDENVVEKISLSIYADDSILLERRAQFKKLDGSVLIQEPTNHQNLKDFSENFFPQQAEYDPEYDPSIF